MVIAYSPLAGVADCFISIMIQGCRMILYYPISNTKHSSCYCLYVRASTAIHPCIPDVLGSMRFSVRPLLHFHTPISPVRGVAESLIHIAMMCYPMCWNIEWIHESIISLITIAIGIHESIIFIRIYVCRSCQHEPFLFYQCLQKDRCILSLLVSIAVPVTFLM